MRCLVMENKFHEFAFRSAHNKIGMCKLQKLNKIELDCLLRFTKDDFDSTDSLLELGEDAQNEFHRQICYPT
jgi:hypothetical protein